LVQYIGGIPGRIVTLGPCLAKGHDALRYRRAADDQRPIIGRLRFGDIGPVGTLRQPAEDMVDQRRRLGLLDIADNADDEPAALEAGGSESGEIVAGDRGNAVLAAIDSTAVGMLLEGVMHPQPPG